MECHECGADISEKAADCPRCGTSIRDSSGSANSSESGGADHGVSDDRPDDGGAEPSDHGVSDERAAPTSSTESPPTGDETESGTADPLDTGAGSSDAESPGSEADTESSSATGEGTGPQAAGEESSAGATEEETGREAAGPPPGDRETTVDSDPDPTDRESTVDSDPDPTDRESTVDSDPDPTDRESTVDSHPGTADQGSDTGSQEPVGGGEGPESGRRGPTVPGSEGSTGAESSDPDVRDGAGSGRAEFGTGTGRDDATVGHAGDGTTDEGPAGHAGDGTTAEESGGTGADPVAQLKSLPFLSAPLAGVVTAVVLAVVSTVVGVLVPNTGSNTVAVGTTVLFDLHFATDGHLPVGLLTQFDTARPPNATLGVLYLLAPLFLYTAAKFVTAYNVGEDTLTPVAGVGGALVAVGYFPAMLVAFVLAPGGPSSPVKLLPAVLLAGLAYPVCFGGTGGLVAGALSGSERRIGTLYGAVSFFLILVGSLVLTVPAIRPADVGLLPQIHASLFTVVAVNGLRLGSPDIGALVLVAYPMVALVVFAAGALRAWNAADVTGPLRGVAKGLSPVATYFTLLGLLATALPLLADPWVARELGLSPNGEALVRVLVQAKLSTIGQYVTAVFVGTLVYAVLLGGCGGLVAGTVRYGLSEKRSAASESTR